MDKRISYKIVIDTETCPLNNTEKEVNPKNSLVYDCGWAIVDKRGKIYKTRSFLVTEVFRDEPDLMKSAYYYNKIIEYCKSLQKGERILTDFYNIKKTLKEDMQEYNVKQVFAHNAFFDVSALNTTERYITKSKYRFFFPYGIEICDTLKMAQSVLKNNKTYKRWCKENNFLTKQARPRYTAEILYKYITLNYNFQEEHTGLEDVKIETAILAYLYSRKKAMKKVLYPSPQNAQKNS